MIGADLVSSVEGLEVTKSLLVRQPVCIVGTYSLFYYNGGEVLVVYRS